MKQQQVEIEYGRVQKKRGMRGAAFTGASSFVWDLCLGAYLPPCWNLPTWQQLKVNKRNKSVQVVEAEAAAAAAQRPQCENPTEACWFS